MNGPQRVYHHPRGPDQKRRLGTKMAKRNIRPVRVEGQVAYVELTKGYVATISAQDAQQIGQHNWLALIGSRTVYAVRSEKVGGKHVTVYMHRFIMDAPDGMDVDHIDRNGLNNTRANLRLATRSENCRNRGPNVANPIGIKGVYPNKGGKSWCAKIRLHGKGYYLGSFPTPEQAHQAYVDASARLHGEFGSAQ
jgi:hypothetical protein